MDGLDRATLGVRLKLGQKVQGGTFEMSELHSNLVTLQVSLCPPTDLNLLPSWITIQCPSVQKISASWDHFKGL